MSTSRLAGEPFVGHLEDPESSAHTRHNLGRGELKMWQGAVLRRGIALVVAVLLLAAIGSTALAHEHREVGDFEFVVGFMNEPAYVNELNGIDLRITRGDDPVENAHETLRAAIIFGEEVMEVDLRPVWGQPGAYTADVIPTTTGTYSFQFIGEIDGQEINETFRGGPDTFSEVEDRAALEFPADPPQVAGETDQAMAIGIAGVVAGLLGLIMGAAAYFKVSSTPARQRTAQQQQAQERPRE
jgi:hypothetical protein